MRLDSLQKAMTAAIAGGPDFVPDGLFAGGRPAALLGLAVHANTISHARLVALEESFPRTREVLGETEFNRLSRQFVETPLATAGPLALIGRHFPDFLGEASGGPLARFEWAWLEAYHAGEAQALTLAGLAGLDDTELLAVTLSLHPAARLVGAAPARWLRREVPGLDEAVAILLTRPDAEVLVSSATRDMAAMFEQLVTPCTVAGLLGDDNAAQDRLAALLALIGAGAVLRAGDWSRSC